MPALFLQVLCVIFLIIEKLEKYRKFKKLGKNTPPTQRQSLLWGSKTSYPQISHNGILIILN